MFPLQLHNLNKVAKHAYSHRTSKPQYNNTIYIRIRDIIKKPERYQINLSSFHHERITEDVVYKMLCYPETFTQKFYATLSEDKMKMEICDASVLSDVVDFVRDSQTFADNSFQNQKEIVKSLMDFEFHIAIMEDFGQDRNGNRLQYSPIQESFYQWEKDDSREALLED